MRASWLILLASLLLVPGCGIDEEGTAPTGTHTRVTETVMSSEDEEDGLLVDLVAYTLFEAPALPDLVVEYASFEFPGYMPREEAFLYFTVANRGDAPSDPGFVDIRFADAFPGAMTLATVDLPQLDAGESIFFNGLPISMPSREAMVQPGAKTVLITADAWDHSGESDEDNNIAAVPVTIALDFELRVENLSLNSVGIRPAYKWWDAANDVLRGADDSPWEERLAPGETAIIRVSDIAERTVLFEALCRCIGAAPRFLEVDALETASITWRILP